jgi:TolB-like protein
VRTSRPLALPPGGSTARPRRRHPLVAVLPFAGASDDLAALGEAMADQLQHELAAVPGLTTVMMNPDLVTKAHDAALADTCRHLRVRYLISGRCHAGPTLYLEVARTRRWNIVWAGFFRGEVLQALCPGEVPVRDVLDGLRGALLRRIAR